MRNHKRLNIAIALSLVVIHLQCSKDETAVPAINFIELSGTWVGTSTIVKTGICEFTNPEANVSQVWIVDQAGSIAITEEAVSGGISFSKSWTGTVDNKYNLSISRDENISCSGTPAKKTITLAGKITKTGSVFSFAAGGNYNICPPECLFNMSYFAAKQ